MANTLKMLAESRKVIEDRQPRRPCKVCKGNGMLVFKEGGKIRYGICGECFGGKVKQERRG